MHDLDRTTLEIGDETENFEFPEEFEFGQQESPFNEVEEEELAAQLLEITDEAELDQFIGGLIKKVSKAARGVIQSPLGRHLGGLVKGAIKKALPIAGGALGGMIAPGVGNTIGSKLGSAAGQIFGLELENLGTEEQEFEVAKRLVRLAGTAVQNAAQGTANAADPRSAAKAAVVAAAKAHAPGLIGAAPGGGPRRNGRAATGRWYRRGGKIIVVGA
jgi:hypothetical protein